MSEFKLKQCLTLLFLSSLLIISTASANENSFGYRIFQIQQKHAIRGSTLAQFKLGTFYEFGISVKPNPQEARVWYEKAAKKRNKNAANRLVYLDIKQTGYFKLRHSDWIKKILNESVKGNVNSVIISGQLYQFGFGVKQDLNKALKLLRTASSNGHTEIFHEIAAIEKQLHKETSVAATKPEVKAKTKPEIKSAGKPVIVKKVEANTAKKAQPIKSESVKSGPSEAEIKDKELRRQRYEKAMRKQYLESLILQQQQDWTEGEEWSDEDASD